MPSPFTVPPAMETSNALDKRLNKDDALDVVRRLEEIQTKSKILGRVLRLPRSTVESIHQQFSDPQERLLHIIDEFVRQVEPRPTWRVILSALRDSLIKENSLALEIGQSITSVSLKPATTQLQPSFMFSPEVSTSAVRSSGPQSLISQPSAGKISYCS